MMEGTYMQSVHLRIDGAVVTAAQVDA